MSSMRATGPIADLSYRNYDGPMHDLGMRWWVIAKMFMRMAIKKKGFWWWALLSTMGYIFLSVVYYFMDALQTRTPSFGSEGAQVNFLDRIVWKDQFYMAFNMAQLWLFFLALLIGAGMIAADSRANALLVYLSKPCSKFDYLFGKWLGMFMVLVIVTASPAIFFIGFTWLSYRQYGSWDSWILLKGLLLITIPAILHSSVMIGLSSIAKQPRMAGATYAGIYFLSLFIAGIATGLSMTGGANNPGLRNFSYFSIDGIIGGISKVVLNTDGGTNLVPTRNPNDNFGLAPPSGLFITIVFLAVCAIFLYLSWRKVRAVEVVGS